MTSDLRKQIAKAKRNKWQTTLERQLRLARLEFEQELKFHPSRRWRADFWIDAGVKPALLIEIHGLTYAKGAHQTFSGLRRDYEKANAAQLLGYVYLQFTGEQVKSGEALRVIMEYLGIE